MLSNFKGLGEQTLSKIAEMALANHLKADKLKVTVKTTPESLAKGIVESICIDSEGLVMSDNQRFQNMKITFSDIKVSPLQALVGNIKLTQPSDGTAFFILSEKDLEHCLNAVKPDNIKQINCCISDDGNLALNILSELHEDNTLNLSIKLNNTVSIEEINANKSFSEALRKRLLQETEALLNLHNFQLKGVSLKINNLALNNGQVMVNAATKITNFPKAI